jgi:hypothetical protein
MTQNALLEVEEATIQWQISMQNSQEVTATTVDQAATALMTIYTNANTNLDNIMKTNTKALKEGSYSPSQDGKPKWSSGINTEYSNEVNAWQTYYNKVSQQWSNLENEWNTPIQSLDTQEQTLGNNSQQASQNAQIITQDANQIASLLQQPL